MPITEKKELLDFEKENKKGYKGYVNEHCTFKPKINKNSKKIAEIKKKQGKKFENFVINEDEEENKAEETLRVKIFFLIFRKELTKVVRRRI